MAQDSVTQRRQKRDSRPTVAAVAVLIALVAFVASFFLLGGPALVTSLFGGSERGANTTGPTGTPENPLSPGANGDAGVLTLPPGMTRSDAERLYVEQVESKKNITRLVNGELTKMAVDKVRVGKSSARVDLTVSFRSGSSAKAVMTLAKFDGSWFVQRLASEATFEGRPARTLEQQKKALGITSMDNGVLTTIIDQEKASQEVLSGLLDGSYTAMTVEESSLGAGTATMDVTISGKDGTTTPGQLVAIQDGIDGPWIVTTYRKQ